MKQLSLIFPEKCIIIRERLEGRNELDQKSPKFKLETFLGYFGGMNLIWVVNGEVKPARNYCRYLQGF